MARRRAHPQGLQGLSDADGNSSPLYDEATVLAASMKRLTPLLLSLQFNGAFPIQELGDVLVGQYVTDSGQPVVIVASKHPETAVTASIKLTGPGIRQDVLSKEQFVRGGNGMMNLPLDAGAGRVLMGAVSCADASWMELR